MSLPSSSDNLVFEDVWLTLFDGRDYAFGVQDLHLRTKFITFCNRLQDDFVDGFRQAILLVTFLPLAVEGCNIFLTFKIMVNKTARDF